MADPLNVGKNDIVSTAPFVDDDDVREDEEQHDEDLNPTTDDGSIETPDTSIVDSEADMNGDSEDSQTVDDFAKYDESSDMKEKIHDLLDIIDVIRQGSRERRADQSKKGNDMTRRIKATDESGKITDTQSADEILDKVTDTGVAFDAPVEEARSEAPQEGAVTGDNYDGSDEDPKDVVALPPQPNGDTTAARKRASIRLSKVTTASSMRLADTYIKAGILPESARYAAVERLSRLSRLAAANQQVALELAMRAASRKNAAARRAAVAASARRTSLKMNSRRDVRKTAIFSDDDAAITWDYQTMERIPDSIKDNEAALTRFVKNEWYGAGWKNPSGVSITTQYVDSGTVRVTESGPKDSIDQEQDTLSNGGVEVKRSASRRDVRISPRMASVSPKTASTIDPALRKAAIAAAKKKIAAASAKKAAAPRIAQRTASATSDPRMALL